MMRKNVELQLQALQMIEFMCGLLPSVLQIEDGETLKNKAKVISPEETERYVLIAVMRRTEKQRRGEKAVGNATWKEEELFSRALAARKEDERRLQKQEGSTTTSSRIETSTPLMQKNAEPGVTPEEAVPQIAERFQTSERRPSVTEKTAPTMAGAPLPAPSERAPSPSGKPPPAPSEKTPPKSRREGRPPTGKRLNTASGAGVETAAQKGAKERRPSTEARKRKELGSLITNTGKKDEQEQEDDGVTYGPRGKNIYDVNDVSQRAAQERPRTARAARGFMRGSRGGIGSDDVLAARRAIVDQLKSEIDDSST
ncbi:hypothetical protein COOONC_17443 [Cooperia oncophora]